MVLSIRRRKRLLWLLLLIGLAAAVASILFSQNRENRTNAMGGSVHAFRHIKEDAQPAAALNIPDEGARFERPSVRPPLYNPYSFPRFENKIIPPFSHSRDVVLAYWGILKDASNMLGFSGGCGTVGYAELPYPYAYALFTPEAKKRMPLEAFIDSFAGYGRILPLQLHDVSAPAGTPSDIAYYLVELESITGRPETGDRRLWEPGGSLFAYHYGLVTAKKRPGDGWKIDQLDFIPEDFLCAPYHGWSYDAASVVGIVFENNLGLVEKIEKTDIEDTVVTVLASGQGRRYRFQFVRLTNGCDILLHQAVLRDGAWVETNLLPPDWAYLQFGPGHLA